MGMVITFFTSLINSGVRDPPLSSLFDTVGESICVIKCKFGINYSVKKDSPLPLFNCPRLLVCNCWYLIWSIFTFNSIVFVPYTLWDRWLVLDWTLNGGCWWPVYRKIMVKKHHCRFSFFLPSILPYLKRLISLKFKVRWRMTGKVKWCGDFYRHGGAVCGLRCSCGSCYQVFSSISCWQKAFLSNLRYFWLPMNVSDTLLVTQETQMAQSNSSLERLELVQHWMGLSRS